MTKTAIRPLTVKQEILVVLTQRPAYGYRFLKDEYMATAKQLEKRGIGTIRKARGGLLIEFHDEDRDVVDTIVAKYKTMFRLGAQQKAMLKELTTYHYKWSSGDSLRVARRLEKLGLATVREDFYSYRTYITPLGRAVAAANCIDY